MITDIQKGLIKIPLPSTITLPPLSTIITPLLPPITIPPPPPLPFSRQFIMARYLLKSQMSYSCPRYSI